MENLSVLNVFNLLPTGLHNSEIFKNAIEEELYDNGNLYPHEVLRTVNITVKILSEIVKSPRFKASLYAEMSDKKEIYDGFTITQKYVNSYDFKNCNDSVYMELYEKMEFLKDNIKKREMFLKAVPEDGIVNGDTGEIINKAEVNSTMSFTVNFKKPKQVEEKEESNPLNL